MAYTKVQQNTDSVLMEVRMSGLYWMEDCKDKPLYKRWKRMKVNIGGYREEFADMFIDMLIKRHREKKIALSV